MKVKELIAELSKYDGELLVLAGDDEQEIHAAYESDYDDDSGNHRFVQIDLFEE